MPRGYHLTSYERSIRCMLSMVSLLNRYVNNQLASVDAASPSAEAEASIKKNLTADILSACLNYQRN